MAVLNAESRFPVVSGVNPDPVEGIPQVDFFKKYLAGLIGP